MLWCVYLISSCHGCTIIHESLQLGADELSVPLDVIDSLGCIKILSLLSLLLQASVDLTANRNASFLLVSKLSILLS